MSILNFRVELTSAGVKDMERNILKEFLLHMSNVLNAIMPAVAARTNQLVGQAFRSSDFYSAVNGGELQDLLCIPSPVSSLYHMERAIVDNISIVRRPVVIAGQFITGGFDVGLLDDSYKEVLSAGETSYSTVNALFVPWMEWILFYSTSPVLSKIRLLDTPRGVMAVKSKTDLAIPSAYAGNAADNVLTRAFRDLEPKIGQLIEDEISRRS